MISFEKPVVTVAGIKTEDVIDRVFKRSLLVQGHITHPDVDALATEMVGDVSPVSNLIR